MAPRYQRQREIRRYCRSPRTLGLLGRLLGAYIVYLVVHLVN